MQYCRAVPVRLGSSLPAAQSSRAPARWSVLCRTLVLFVIPALVTGAGAQSDRDVRLYQDAITTLQRQQDPIDLQRFVSTAPFGHLKDDGLQWLIWEFRSSHDGRARQWAEELLKVQPNNALALATVADAEHQIGMSRRALSHIDELKAPEGMPGAQFEGLKAELSRDLNGAIGFAFYQRNDLPSARIYLRNAISASSSNAQYTYALAIADLYGKDPDEAEGFQMLARTVNLMKGSPQGQQFADFARQKYIRRGGSDASWDQFLQNTAGGVALARADSAKPPAITNTPEPVKPATPPVAEAAKNLPPPAAEQPRPTTNAAVLEATPPGFPVRTQRPLMPAGAPFSLGILVETAKTSPASRRAVVNSLTDMVRHLREDDEAFVVSFSRQVVFEQDLTGNAKALESAIDSIKPDRGTALLDAVAFAAGHLNRIAKNQKKVLLVISDGENENEQGTPLEVSGELNASKVEIYCIGMGADSSDDRYRLQALARRTGGQVLFVDGTSQFRRATQDIAKNLGVAFP